MSIQKLVIATRQSRLALWQAEHVKERLESLHPGLEVDLLPMSTKGDEVLDRSLEKVGAARASSSRSWRPRWPPAAPISRCIR